MTWLIVGRLLGSRCSIRRISWRRSSLYLSDIGSNVPRIIRRISAGRVYGILTTCTKQHDNMSKACPKMLQKHLPSILKTSSKHLDSTSKPFQSTSKAAWKHCKRIFGALRKYLRSTANASAKHRKSIFRALQKHLQSIAKAFWQLCESIFEALRKHLRSILEALRKPLRSIAKASSKAS